MRVRSRTSSGSGGRSVSNLGGDLPRWRRERPRAGGQSARFASPRAAPLDTVLCHAFEEGSRGSRSLREHADRSPPACCETFDLTAIAR